MWRPLGAVRLVLLLLVHRGMLKYLLSVTGRLVKNTAPNLCTPYYNTVLTSSFITILLHDIIFAKKKEV
jgi:hypothetical protein